MKRFKVNISYLFLLIKKHPLYISVYGFFELYNTAFISFKNVYLYVILLRMIANSLSIKKILAFLIISAIVSAAMLFLSALFHEIIEPKTRCLIEKEFDEEIFKKLSSVDVSCFDDDKFYNDVIISTSSVANYIINNFIQTVNFIKSVFSIFTLLPLLMAVNSIWILFVIAGVIFVNFLLNKKTEKIKYEENQSLIPHTRKINYINKIFISKDSACDVHTHYSADFVLNIMNDVTEKKIKIKKNFCFKKFLLSLADQLLCHMFFIEKWLIISKKP